jgi:uncharacterized cupredoxin-like copper-binding protein
MYRKVSLILAAAVLLYGCAQAPSAATEISIEETEFSYSPSSFTVPAGQPVTLTITNVGQAEHDFVIEKIAVTDVIEEGNPSAEHSMHDMGEADAYDLHVATQKGGTSVLKFTPLESGTYQVLCTVAGHKEAGMVAELIVVGE